MLKSCLRSSVLELNKKTLTLYALPEAIPLKMSVHYVNGKSNFVFVKTFSILASGILAES